MPSRSQLPGNIDRKKFFKSLERLGFIVNTQGGKGSHIKLIWKNHKSTTVHQDLRKDVLYYLLKEIETLSGITWDDIRKNL